MIYINLYYIYNDLYKFICPWLPRRGRARPGQSLMRIISYKICKIYSIYSIIPFELPMICKYIFYKFIYWPAAAPPRPSPPRST